MKTPKQLLEESPMVLSATGMIIMAELMDTYSEAKNSSLKLEVEKYREALLRIAKYPLLCARGIDMTNNELATRAVKIAEQALK